MADTLTTLFTKLIFEKEKNFLDDVSLIESLNSQILTSIDIKPPKNFTTDFKYVRFVPDETTNDSGNNLFRFRQVGERIIEDKELKVPRYVKLSWTPKKFENDNLRLLLRRFTQKELEEFNRIRRINSITQFSNGNFFNLILRDSTTDNKLYTIISSSFEVLKEKQAIQSAAGSVALSPEEKIAANANAFEKMAALNARLSSDEAQNFINQEIFSQEIDNKRRGVANTLGILESIVQNFGSEIGVDDYKILDDRYSENKKVEHVNMFKQIPLKATINNKYLYTISKNVENNETSLFSDEFANFSFVFEEVEHDAITEFTLQKFELGVLERSITSVDSIEPSNLCLNVPGEDEAANRKRQAAKEQLDALFSNEGYKSTIRIIGYVIDKYFIDNSGNKKIYDSILIDDERFTNFIDNEIIYGVTYYYKIATLFEYIIPFTADPGKYKFARILIKGDNDIVSVKTTEAIPPAPPQDFFVRYLPLEKGVSLTWARDLGSTQDVIKYIVFKRETISEPFKAIAYINFAPQNMPLQEQKFSFDSSVEIINEEFGRTMFIDKKFDLNKKAIYAVIAGDAHELYSNYSTQLEAKYDRRTNKLLVKQISFAGAPIPYPNFYVNQSLFEKAIFSERSKKISLIFDPDCYNVDIQNDSGLDGKIDPVVLFSNNDNDDEEDENDESYIMTLINTELAKSQKINIKVNDRRSVK